MICIQVEVHYHGYHAKFNEWITRSSPRIRPFGRYKSNLSTKQSMVNVHMKRWHVPILPNNNNNNNSICNINSNSNSSTNTIASNGSNGSIVDLQHIVESHRHRTVTAVSDHYQQYTMALADRHLAVVSVDGDGNCLFRAISHQIYGSDSYHGVVRSNCMDYMEVNAIFFSQFVVGGLDSFPLYVAAKRLNAVWGDDPEIHAMCEMYNIPAEIWAHDSRYGAKKLLTFHEGSSGSSGSSGSGGVNNSGIGGTGGGTGAGFVAAVRSPCMRLSYYGGGHYDSIVYTNDSSSSRSSNGNGNGSGSGSDGGDYLGNNDHCDYRGILSGVAPGVVERVAIDRARRGFSPSTPNSNNNSSSNSYSGSSGAKQDGSKSVMQCDEEEQVQLEQALMESRKNLVHNLCYEQTQTNTSNGTGGSSGSGSGSGSRSDYVSGDVEQSMLWSLIQQDKSADTGVATATSAVNCTGTGTTVVCDASAESKHRPCSSLPSGI